MMKKTSSFRKFARFSRLGVILEGDETAGPVRLVRQTGFQFAINVPAIAAEPFHVPTHTAYVGNTEQYLYMRWASIS